MRAKTNHLWIHAGLISFTLLSIYPVLGCWRWLLGPAECGHHRPAVDPTFLERAARCAAWPAHFSLKNFVDVMTEQPFGRGCSQRVGLVVDHRARRLPGLHRGLRVQPLPLPGARQRHAGLLVSQMFPGTLMLIPLFIIIVKWLGLGNTYWGLVIATRPPRSRSASGCSRAISTRSRSTSRIGTHRRRQRAGHLLPHHPAAGQAGHRHHRIVLVHDGMERVHPGLVFLEAEAMYTAPVGLRFFVGASPPSGILRRRFGDRFAARRHPVPVPAEVPGVRPDGRKRQVVVMHPRGVETMKKRSP